MKKISWIPMSGVVWSAHVQFLAASALTQKRPIKKIGHMRWNINSSLIFHPLKYIFDSGLVLNLQNIQSSKTKTNIFCKENPCFVFLHEFSFLGWLANRLFEVPFSLHNLWIKILHMGNEHSKLNPTPKIYSPNHVCLSYKKSFALHFRTRFTCISFGRHFKCQSHQKGPVHI